MNQKFTFLYTFAAVSFILALGSQQLLPATSRVKTAAAATTQPTAVSVHSSNVNEFRFSLETALFSQAADNMVVVPGLSQRLLEPGAPGLPYYATYIALPPAASASISVTAAAFTERSIGVVAPAPDVQFNLSEDIGVESYPSPTYQPNSALYNNDSYYPNQLYSLSEPMYYRDLRLVALQLYPVQYNPVTGKLRQAQELEITVRFTGANMADLKPLAISNSQLHNGLANLVLNYETGQNWRSLPAVVSHAPTTALPLDTETYKITLTEDGIYDLCQAELAAAGMDVSSVNPNTFEMLYRGAPFAYQFLGDADPVFETGECLRFFGWAFAGPRSEKQFITENVYWLWAGGTPTLISTAPNQTAGEIKSSAWYSETREPELDFFSTWTDGWPTFDNEPDAWFWDRINANVTTGVYSITVTHPDAAAAAAEYLAEFSSRAKSNEPQTVPYTVTTAINNSPTSATEQWLGRRNINIGETIDTTYLLSGTNQVTITFDMAERIYLNRITVNYMRQLIADTDQLIFTDESGGNPLAVSDFGNSNALVWEVTDPTQPTAVDMASGVSGSGPFTYTFGLNHNSGSRFIATVADNVKTIQAESISDYIPQDLDPPSGQADWLAITHQSFINQANTLANHRATEAFGGMATHIVDIEDIINQYGYGLPLPVAVKDYLTYALGNWTVAPSYVVMLGDATINPRGLACAESCSTWDEDAPHLVLTDLQFIDRYQGLVPTDHTFVLLSGNDLLADMAIGRIAVETESEAAAAVQKIIHYENNPYDTDPPPATNPTFLFIADNDDDGGFFCFENDLTRTHVQAYETESFCLGTAAYPDVATLQNAMFSRIQAGIHVLNYRGHGSVRRWASEEIMTPEDVLLWNSGKQTVMLSADCLDGHFAWPGLDAMSEIFLRADEGFPDKQGSAGMWSSSGLGLTGEHTVLHTGFYDGLFTAYGRTFGNAALYSKLQYAQTPNHPSELYTFTLQGDPAMLFYWAPEEPLANVYLPLIQNAAE